MSKTVQLTRPTLLPILGSDQVRLLTEPGFELLYSAVLQQLQRMLPTNLNPSQAQARSILKRARGYRLYFSGDLLRYLILSAILGEGFENQPRYAVAGRFLQRTGWPGSVRIEQVMSFCISLLEREHQQGAGREEALLLSRLDKKIAKQNNGPEGPIAMTLAAIQDSTLLQVCIIQGEELFYPITPGIRRPVLELQAAGMPVGGFFRWEVESEEPVILSTNGSRAWIRPRKPGEARVSVFYYFGGEMICAHTLVRVRPAARIRVTPDLRQFGDIFLGTASAPLPITIANIGGSPLKMGPLPSSADFHFETDEISGISLEPDQKIELRLICKPTASGPISQDLIFPCDATNAHDARVKLRARGCWPNPVVECVSRPEGEAVRWLAPGLWDRAWNAKDGSLYNGPNDRNHFIGRDGHAFYIRVSDPWALALNRKTVQLSWWTRRDRDLGDENRPGETSITLIRKGRFYLSRPLMLVTREQDYATPCHSGLEGGKLVQPGCADFRMRLLCVDDRDRLDRHLFLSYSRQGAGEEVFSSMVPVYNRHPDIRRQVVVQMINVRITPGGKGVASRQAIQTWQQQIRETCASCGLFVQFEVTEVDPPGDCRNWSRRQNGARDAGVESAIKMRIGHQLHWVPSPSQLQLIDACCPDPDRVYVFLTNGIYNPLDPTPIEGESFFAARTRAPLDLVEACTVLNLQYTARALAFWLCPGARRFREQGWTQTRRNRLRRWLEDLVKQVGTREEGIPELPARLFLDSLEQPSMGKNAPPAYIQQTIAAAREDVYPVFYKPATLGAMMEAARGCIFLANPNRISPKQPVFQTGLVLANPENLDSFPSPDPGSGPGDTTGTPGMQRFVHEISCWLYRAVQGDRPNTNPAHEPRMEPDQLDPKRLKVPYTKTYHDQETAQSRKGEHSKPGLFPAS